MTLKIKKSFQRLIIIFGNFHDKTFFLAFHLAKKKLFEAKKLMLEVYFTTFKLS